MTAPLQSHPIAPLIQFTLIGLYLALVMPLPFVATGTMQVLLLWAIPLGLILMVALTSERVTVDNGGIKVGYPRWCNWLLQRGWSLEWQKIQGLTPVTTSQGGRVYYVRSTEGIAYLLPQRVANFEAFLSRFQQASGIDTSNVVRITPPWTYQLLAVLSGALLVGEGAMGLWMGRN